MDRLPRDVLIEIAGHTSLRGLVLLSSCCRDFRNLLEHPAVWRLRCERKALPMLSFVYLGERGVLRSARTIELHQDDDDDDQWHVRQPMPPENLAALRILKLHTSLRPKEVAYAFRTLPRESLEQLHVPLGHHGGILFNDLMMDGQPFSKLTHLVLRLYSFTRNHLSVVTLQCPNLTCFKLRVTSELYEFWNVSDEQKQRFAAAAAAVPFSKLETLVYWGDLIVAPYFHDATALSSLNLTLVGDAESLQVWTRLKAENVTDLRVLDVWDEPDTHQALFHLLVKWCASLKTVLLPKHFVERGKLLEFLERHECRRLERLYYIYDKNDQDGVRMRQRLVEKCPTLKEILEARKHL